MVIDSHWSLPRFSQEVELLDHLTSKWAQGREKGETSRRIKEGSVRFVLAERLEVLVKGVVIQDPGRKR